MTAELMYYYHLQKQSIITKILISHAIHMEYCKLRDSTGNFQIFPKNNFCNSKVCKFCNYYKPGYFRKKINFVYTKNDICISCYQHLCNDCPKQNGRCDHIFHYITRKGRVAFKRCTVCHNETEVFLNE